MSRYDEGAYREWLSARGSLLIDNLRLMLDCLSIQVSNEALDVTFLYDERSQKSPNDQAVSRLSPLRSVFPFADRYRSRGVWLLPSGLSPSVDGTIKDMPRINLNVESDIVKNMTWLKSVEIHYSIDCFYDYQQSWHDLRRQSLAAVRSVSHGLRRLRTPDEAFNVTANQVRNQSFIEIDEANTRLPSPPVQAPEDLTKLLTAGTRGWSSAFHNFIRHAVKLSADSNDATAGRLTLSNFRDAQKRLGAMHDAFSSLFEIAPDYFNSTGLNVHELRDYEELGLLLESWLIDRPQAPQRDMLRYARLRQVVRERQLIEAAERALDPNKSKGMEFILPSCLVHDHPLVYFPLGFSVATFCRPIDDLEQTMRALSPVVEVANFFCFVPTYHGARVDGCGYLVSARELPDLINGQSGRWEALVPREVPSQVLATLLDPPVIPLEGPLIRSGIHDMLIGLKTCCQGERMLAQYNWTGSKPERALIVRSESRFSNYRRELISAARELEVRVSLYTGERQQAQDQQAVLGFLQKVQAILGEHPMGGIQMHLGDEQDEAMNAADRLFCVPISFTA